MMIHAILITLVAISAANSPPPTVRGVAEDPFGCGPDDDSWDIVTRHKEKRFSSTPAPGRAVIYVFGPQGGSRAANKIYGFGLHKEIVTRIGVNGQWIAAVGHKAYTFFKVDSGLLRMCLQSKWTGGLAGVAPPARPNPAHFC